MREKPDIIARLRDPSLGSPRWTDTMDEAAKELARLRRFVQYVADFSNDPAVVREAMAHGATWPEKS